MSEPFVKTAKQIDACRVINSVDHSMLYGGSRSGKTTIIIRNIFLRAIMKPSRHLIVRFRFNHAKTSLWYDTIPKVLAMCFPGVNIQENKSDWYYTVPTVCGGESTVWIGGIDDKERVEKILGNEYSTIYANECSQIMFDAITTLWTRLAESSGLALKFYYDCNPPGKKHWSYKLFIELMMPETEEKSVLESNYLLINPADNIKNLPAKYLKILAALPKRQRQRFLDGLFLSDVEGALWTDAMVENAKNMDYQPINETVVAVDPATTNNPGSDECGIVICSKDDAGQGVVQDDWSGKMSTNAWANRAVNAYNAFEANYIVAEVNQGGDLVEDAIKSVDPNVKVIKVHASKSKKARAEPVAALYEQGKIAHAKALLKLESEMTEWVPMDTKESPNRLDAVVWGLTQLFFPKKTPRKVRVSVVG